MADFNAYGDLVANKDRGFKIRSGVHDGKEIIGVLEHGLEAPAEFFHQLFIGVMDDLKLVGKENNARGVCIVKPDLCGVGEHSFDYIKPLTNTKKIVLCLIPQHGIK